MKFYCYNSKDLLLEEENVFRHIKRNYASGGYGGGDSWRMNSGIKSFTEDDEYYYFKGLSGSVYKCYKQMETVKMNNGGVAKKLKESGFGKVVKFNDIKDNQKTY